MPKNPYGGRAPNRSAAQRQRDAALARVARARRATIFGAGALTAGLAGLVSALAPGRTLAKVKVPTRTASVTRRRAPTAAVHMPPLARPSQLGLRPPAAAPQASSSPSASPPAPSSPSASPSTSSSPSPPTQPAAPPPVQTVPAPAPAPSGGSGAAVSGGS